MMAVAEKLKMPAETHADTRPLGLSVEALLYVALAVLAILLRISGLWLWPLNPAEAGQAMGAWNLAHGAPVDTAFYSPLLMTGNLLLFSLFQATDASARVWPALFGALLALAPALLRRPLGRVGALAASLLLALSPSLMTASRRLDGQIAALAAGLLLVGLVVRWRETGQIRWQTGGAVVLAAGLLSAPPFYAILLILLSGGLLLWLLRGWLAPHAPASSAKWVRLERPAQWGVIFLAALALLGTGLLFNLDGLGMAAGLLPAWVKGFAWGEASLSPLVRLWALPVYEALLLIFGVAGIVRGVRRRDPLALLLGWWALLGLLLSLVNGGWQPIDLALLAVPLALLAGSFLGDLLVSCREEPFQEAEWLLFGVAIPFSVFAYVQLAAYSRAGKPVYVIFSLILVPLAYAVLVVPISLWVGVRRAGRAAGLAIALIGLAALIGISCKGNFNGQWERRELLALERSEAGLRDLVAAVERVSDQSLGDAHAVPVQVVGDGLTWTRWALRQMEHVRYVGSYAPGDATEVVITAAGAEPAIGELYSGQDMVIRSEWQQAQLRGQALVSWLLFRKPAAPAQNESVILWVAQAPVEP